MDYYQCSLICCRCRRSTVDATVDVNHATVEVNDATVDIIDATGDVIDATVDVIDAAVDVIDAAVDVIDAAVFIRQCFEARCCLRRPMLCTVKVLGTTAAFQLFQYFGTLHVSSTEIRQVHI